MDPNEDGKITFAEFLGLLQKVSGPPSRYLKTGGGQSEFQGSPRFPSDEEKKKFGEFLPRTGVYFLPDIKVLDLLKLLNEYRMQCQKTGKYGDADKARNKFALVSFAARLCSSKSAKSCASTTT